MFYKQSKEGRLTGFVTSCVGTVKGKKEGRVEVTVRRGRRRKHLMYDRTEGTGYWKVKEKAQDRNVCRTRFGSSYEHVVRQATE
jgi:hypothetical protein